MHRRARYRPGMLHVIRPRILCRSLPLAALVAVVSPVHATPPTPEREAYAATVASILAKVDSKRAYDHLVELCDDIGHRLSGSPELDQAIEWAKTRLTADGQENVRAEPVQVRRWVRGEESLALVSPRARPLALIGLGGSIGTPAGGLEAEVIVVEDEAALERRKAEVKGRIVLFNAPMADFHPVRGPGYGEAVRFRAGGPKLAAAHGAVAVLVRSVTARSLYTPHTGATSTREGPCPIPAAAIPIEDAEFLARLDARGKHPRVRLHMGARDEGMVPSANVVAELVGRERPDEIVVISGHLDSWDIGQGAQDDGAGVIMAMEALATLRRLDLRPRRTIRVVLWTNEENGLAGALAYADSHKDQLGDHVAAIEADTGCDEPLGYSVESRDPALTARSVEQLEGLLSLLRPIGATVVDTGFSGSDVMPMREGGVVLLGHRMELDAYFDVHHSPADTVDKIRPETLARNVAALAATAWMLAERPARLGAVP